MKLLAPLLAAAAAQEGLLGPEYFARGQASEPHSQPLLSRTLGSNMVLQRAPQRAVVWGFAAPGAVVTTALDGGAALSATAGADGVWRQRLPATEGGPEAHTLLFNASDGASAKLENVLFGDVYICGGQSNMQFAVPGDADARQIIEEAADYPLLRLFTVGQGTQSEEPLSDLKTVEQGWSVPSSKTIAGKGGFSYFSSVCWVFGREVFKGLGGKIPLGLVSNNWGGTPVESWSTKASLESCNATDAGADGMAPLVLFNAMVHPYVVGPMALTGFTWYQGEANTGKNWARYACTFPAMIEAWRQAFGNEEAYFGFVQLSTWCSVPAGSLPSMRAYGQMSALKLPKVGYATNADHGAGCNVHPTHKRFCATRLANSALALQYGQDIPWRSPTFKSQSAADSPPSVTVELQDLSASGLQPQYPFNYMDGAFDCSKNAGKCAWAELQLDTGDWVNASVSMEAGTLRLSAASGRGKPLASRYGWGDVPMLSAYDKGTGLPVLPWSEKVRAEELLAV